MMTTSYRFLSLRDRVSDTPEKHRVPWRTLHESSRRLVLKFHQLQMRRDQMQIWDVSAPYDLANWPALFVISNCAVERVIGPTSSSG